MFIRINLLVFLILVPLAFSQTFTRELSSIPFSDASGPIKNVFSGGINNFEFQFVDLDNDGDDDLPFLDSDNSCGIYWNTGSPSSPEFTLSLEGIPGFYANNWFYLTDIDGDGDYDLFTNGADNFISFYKNTGTVSSPFFQLAEDTLKDESNVPIFTEFSSNPLFADIDADGDMDFFSGNSAGTVTYYENTGNQTQYIFKFITNVWQDLVIISEENHRHGASSLDFVDIDNDLDLDLFWGDFFSRSLYFIKNLGTPSAPDMEVILRVYPPNEDSIYTSGFNMPRFTDIDGDNDRDLFVSVLYDPTVPQTLMFYLNEGNMQVPSFNLITANFLKTLDTGAESAPYFIDFDYDGDPDLFSGSSKNPEGTLFYFENTGTANSPSFMLTDTAFAGISGELSIAPAGADLDNDGDIDILIGNFDGTIGYFRNDGTAGQPIITNTGKLQNSSQQNIDIGLIARPFLIDIDSDNDYDLILGNFNGNFALYRNIGNQTSFLFLNEPSYFESVDVGENSTPFLIDFDNDRDFDLFSGNRSGDILYFRNDGTNILPIWISVTNHFLEEYTGGITNPVFCDIENDTDYDLFVGNIKGGFYFFRNTTVNDVNESDVKMASGLHISAYPNPFNSEIKITVDIPVQDFYKIIIFNHLGEEIFKIFDNSLVPGNKIFTWNGRNNFNYPVASGNYIAAVLSESYSKFKNIILLK